MILRTYSKAELAKLYFPDALPKSALRRLTRWIQRCKPLCEALEESGYETNHRFFNSIQVGHIVKFLGEPDIG